MKHLVIIDGHHLLYRAYWAIPRTMRTSKGEQVNTVFGIASMLLLILRTELPDSVLFCFDAGNETFRHTEYAEYKSGRQATPDDFYVQIPRARAVIDAFGIRCVEDAGFEADDFACSYARAAERAGDRVTIVSGDRDLFQLASSTIRIAIPHKGYQAAEYLGEKEVLAKYGVTPEQIPSYKGLVGDASDNLHGVKGIGPKAAASLIAQYGSIEEIYKHLPNIKSSWRSKLESDREQAFFCERMALLKCDIDLPVPLADLELHDIPAAPILQLFSELEFSLATKRFQSLLSTSYGLSHFRTDPGSLTAASPDSRLSDTVDQQPKEAVQMSLL
ncbi:MAG: 5'-3' exonuclease H3TH domain-containing protein [Candidatus Peribacteraceae bacterium]|nr:5'-3' exonuclease H3TH domain-containing protein [Candidatus Peribacteraceae bacterium]